MKIKNNWKVATIILLFLIVGLVSYQIYEYKFAEYNLDGFKISKENFNKLTTELPKGIYNLCNTDNTQCIRLYREMLK